MATSQYGQYGQPCLGCVQGVDYFVARNNEIKRVRIDANGTTQQWTRGRGGNAPGPVVQDPRIGCDLIEMYYLVDGNDPPQEFPRIEAARISGTTGQLLETLWNVPVRHVTGKANSDISNDEDFEDILDYEYTATPDLDVRGQIGFASIDFLTERDGEKIPGITVLDTATGEILSSGTVSLPSEVRGGPYCTTPPGPPVLGQYWVSALQRTYLVGRRHIVIGPDRVLGLIAHAFYANISGVIAAEPTCTIMRTLGHITFAELSFSGGRWNIAKQWLPDPLDNQTIGEMIDDVGAAELPNPNCIDPFDCDELRTAWDDEDIIRGPFNGSGEVRMPWSLSATQYQNGAIVFPTNLSQPQPPVTTITYGDADRGVMRNATGFGTSHVYFTADFNGQTFLYRTEMASGTWGGPFGSKLVLDMFDQDENDPEPGIGSPLEIEANSLLLPYAHCRKLYTSGGERFNTQDWSEAEVSGIDEDPQIPNTSRTWVAFDGTDGGDLDVCNPGDVCGRPITPEDCLEECTTLSAPSIDLDAISKYQCNAQEQIVSGERINLGTCDGEEIPIERIDFYSYFVVCAKDQPNILPQGCGNDDTLVGECPASICLIPPWFVGCGNRISFENAQVCGSGAAAEICKLGNVSGSVCKPLDHPSTGDIFHCQKVLTVVVIDECGQVACDSFAISVNDREDPTNCCCFPPPHIDATIVDIINYPNEFNGVDPPPVFCITDPSTGAGELIPARDTIIEFRNNGEETPGVDICDYLCGALNWSFNITPLTPDPCFGVQNTTLEQDGCRIKVRFRHLQYGDPHQVKVTVSVPDQLTCQDTLFFVL